MTKRRFVNKGKDIFHYGEWWCSAGGEHCADVIATALNEIMDKNAQLKKENEQLKQIAEEFIENKTQHNLWKLRTILKELKGDLE